MKTKATIFSVSQGTLTTFIFHRLVLSSGPYCPVYCIQGITSNDTHFAKPIKHLIMSCGSPTLNDLQPIMFCSSTICIFRVRMLNNCWLSWQKHPSHRSHW